MKRSAAIASGAARLLACAFAAQAQEKISDGVVKIGMLEDYIIGKRCSVETIL